ncbi:glycosyltransferase [Bacillus paranthracis]|uniref:glycosyltransferase n=2 Tax=Bacillus paranthracis TaxID=2026186 RepID=UPI00065C16B2|nr:glycosyltransferase [Bacillus paranthracis]MBL3846435.1 glycosyltransferase [Bacillus cereus]MCC2502373.1 glycosyltransferase [Bacillus paranthracis]MDG1612419.1 glycosyltransferase [Bacillus paranthracis]
MLQVAQLKNRLQEVQQVKNTLLNNPVLNKLGDLDKTKLVISELQDKKWFISKDYKEIIKLNENIATVKQEREKFIYISYGERNINFTKKPINKLFDLEPNKTYRVNFKGEKSGELEVNLYIIMYPKTGNPRSEIIPLDSEWKFNLLPNTESIRIGMKFIGEGTVDFQGIEVLECNPIQKLTFIEGGANEVNKLDKFSQYVKDVAKHRNQLQVSKDTKIAVILDEFSYECFKYEANLLPITQENWKEVIEKESPEMLLVESAWAGNKGAWNYKVANLHKNNRHPQLKELVDFCKAKGIPTVFWDKEGKDNFEVFKEAGSYFDYIFVTDEHNIDNFKNCAKHDRVYPLSFAAQPRIHNPINKNRGKLGTVAFSGSWYGNKHPDRIKDVENIVAPAVEFDLDIYDRFYGVEMKTATDRTWPDLYQDSIIGNLSYDNMVEAYKNYDVFLNVNSIQNSKYMFSRRVYEVLASKTMVISGDSVGVREQVGDYLYISDAPEKTRNMLKVLLQNPLKLEREAKLAQRFIMENHTYSHRLEEMFDIIGIQYQKKKEKLVSVVAITNRPQFMDNIYENLSNQTYENIEHIIILNNNNMNIKQWEKKFENLRNTRIFKVDEKNSLGACLNFAVGKTKGEFIAKMDDDDYYAPNYLKDMLMSFDYTDASIIGKSTYLVHFEENNALVKRKIGAGEERYSNFVAGATLVFKKEVFEKLKGFDDRNTGEDTKFIEKALKNGYKIYSNDSYNFCVIRRKNKATHTWQITDDDMLKQGHTVAFTKDFQTYVTV